MSTLPTTLLLRAAANAHIDAMRAAAAQAGSAALVGEAMLTTEGSPGALAALRGDEVVVLVDGAPVRVVAQHLGGLIDVNLANPELLRAFFGRLGLSAGAERLIERRAGRPLRSIREIARVAGASDAQAETLAQATTVRGGGWGIVVDKAPRAVSDVLGDAELARFAESDQGGRVRLEVRPSR